MLQVEQLTKSFGDRVLFSDISFSIERGQKVGLIAPNGTGKSTLMHILLGREPQDSGTITYERDIKHASSTVPVSGRSGSCGRKACLMSRS